jgi:hypothetical protein
LKIISDKEIIETLRTAARTVEKVSSAIKTETTYSGMENDIDFLFKCAFDKRKAIWDGCSEELFALAQISNAIRERIIKIMETGNAHEKFVITVSTSSRELSDKQFIREILYWAITDKSKKVKIFGAQRAYEHNLYDLAETIKNESKKTSDDKIKKALEEAYISLTL